MFIFSILGCWEFLSQTNCPFLNLAEFVSQAFNWKPAHFLFFWNVDYCYILCSIRLGKSMKKYGVRCTEYMLKVFFDAIYLSLIDNIDLHHTSSKCVGITEYDNFCPWAKSNHIILHIYIWHSNLMYRYN